ncbi:membrane protein [Alcaligenes sp. EGD-AK7]|uniref:DMT family transporter n=1 Tax=Alcaligenes sp. EGD-AK7 TaxID=1386079 RepID=UPI0002AAA0F4|nr:MULTISPECIES: DMT family transporter [unclassified Alcaligenes]EKU28581.1 hypothetical protein C660_19827 [Alcaligenes sp. HPC1271]ERI33387.1 membrane protein [Alcaligenes sp. EGD-AK7]
MPGPALFSMLVAVFAGSAVPFQAASNAVLGKVLGHPLWATLVSLCISAALVLPTIWLMRAPAPLTAQLAHAPWWVWTGGVGGVIYISAALILTPRMGAASFIVCVVAGQMLSSMLIDHYGLMGLTPRPVHMGRILGVLLILAGMGLVQWFTPSVAAAAESKSATADHSGAQENNPSLTQRAGADNSTRSS